MNVDKKLLTALLVISVLWYGCTDAEHTDAECANKDDEDVAPQAINNKNASVANGNCPNVRSSDVLLSRKRRALMFPTGSNFVITLSLVKAILIGIPLGWNIALEIDIPYKMVGFADLFKHKFPRHRLHRRQRRELWKGMESVMTANGIDGQYCVMRAMCEAQYFLAPKDTNFAHDILRTLLSVPEDTHPDDRYKQASKEVDCNKYNGEKKCPISMLELLVKYGRVV